MEKNISVEELITALTNIDDNTAIESIYKEKIQIQPYVGYLTKVEIITKILDFAMWDYNDDGKKIRINFKSDVEYLIYIRSLLELYTNIKIEADSNFIEEYDMLKASGALEQILAMIPESEINEFSNIYDRKLQDLTKNYFSLPATTNTTMNRIIDGLGILTAPVINSISEALADLDIKQILNKTDGLSKK